MLLKSFHKIIKSFAAAGMAIGLFLSGGQNVYASSIKPLENAVNEIRQGVNSFISAKDEAQTEEDKEEKKLVAAKKTLSKIIELGASEVKNHADKLDDLKIEELVAADYTFDAVELHETLQNVLTYYEAYYNDMLKRVNDLKTYGEARSLAKDIKNWREKTYNSDIQRIIALNIVLNQKSVLKTANARFEKILTDLRKLKKAGLINLFDLQTQLNAATADLKSSEALDEEMTRFLLKTLRAVPLGSELKNSSDSEAIVDSQRIYNLAEQSFKKIRDAYKNFMDMNEAVKKMMNL